MKRILLMLMAAALMAAGCETQVITPSKKVGELKLSVSCSTDGYQDKLLVKSAEGLDTDHFTVVISKLEDEWGEASDWTKTWTLAQFPSVLELAPGKFKITVASPESERLATDRPTFFVEKEFSIIEDVVTPLELVCGVTNMKVTLAPTDNFFSELTRFTVTVSAEYEGIDAPVAVSWTETDFQAGQDGRLTTSKVAYFEPVPLKVMVTGNRAIDGSDASLKEPVEINDVEAKDHHILNIDVQVTGELDTKNSYIIIDSSYNEPTDVPVEVPGFEEIPIPDEPEQGEDPGQEPEPETAAPSLKWDANPGFETVHVTKAGILDKEMNLTILCPGKIKEFVITPSENFHAAIAIVTGGPVILDLINNETLYEAFAPEGGMYLPTGDELRGHTEVDFNLGGLAALIPIVAQTTGERTVFSLYIEDETGKTYTKDIEFETID